MAKLLLKRTLDIDKLSFRLSADRQACEQFNNYSALWWLKHIKFKDNWVG